MAFFKGDIISKELNMQTGINVILPNGAVNSVTPVVYLLHGYSDNCSNWSRNTAVERYANQHGVAVVMPEVQHSFYCDMKHGMNYFSYISGELIQIVHQLFNLPTSKELTYVAGLSMGGFGAMKCALTKPEQYAAVAAFSSVCCLDDVVERGVSGFDEFAGIFGFPPVIGEENNLAKLAKNCGKTAPRMIMTCGTEDFLYEQNTTLRAQLEVLPIDYEYHEWAGGHSWEFWDISIKLAFGKLFGSTK